MGKYLSLKGNNDKFQGLVLKELEDLNLAISIRKRSKKWNKNDGDKENVGISYKLNGELST